MRFKSISTTEAMLYFAVHIWTYCRAFEGDREKIKYLKVEMSQPNTVNTSWAWRVVSFHMDANRASREAR